MVAVGRCGDTIEGTYAFACADMATSEKPFAVDLYFVKISVKA